MTARSRLLLVLTGAVVLATAAAARPTPAQVTFDWTTVGNPGNAPDTLVMDKSDFTTGYGAVDYVYRIAKHHVTNAQYAQFLNAVDATGSNAWRLYDTRMSTNSLGLAYTGGIDRFPTAATGAKYGVKAGQEHYPAVWITWAAGARFVNWLANGQGAGGTESGVYDMAAIPMNNGFATPPPRAGGATVFLPSEDEYYKAAYYDPTKNGGLGGYWQYGTRSDTAPASVAPPGSTNSANIGAGLGSGGVATTLAKTAAGFDASVDYLTDVGAYASSASFYGLYDTEGLVYNWTEATRTVSTFVGPAQLPIYRGGSWRYGEGYDGAAYRNVYSGAGSASYAWYGLRIAGLPPPATDVVIDVVSGTQSQGQAGYPLLTPAEALSVTKTGAGTLVFAAPNTYTGDTIIAAGVLALTGSGSIASSELVRIDSAGRLDVMDLPAGLVVPAGQTIAGRGTISGSVIFGRGSTLSPGGAGVEAAGRTPVAVVPEPPMLPWWAGALSAVVAACRRRFRCLTWAMCSRSSPPSSGA